jgi:DNA-binding MarR family transcriptional regulator
LTTTREHTGATAAARAQTADVLRLALGRGARRLRQQAGQELTPSRAAVLDTIAHHGPLSPSKLAELERISRPTITRMVATLKEQGLVDCTADPDDGRSYRIAISQAGSALRERRRRRKYEYLARLLADAGAKELELLERASQVLLRLLEEEH